MLTFANITIRDAQNAFTLLLKIGNYGTKGFLDISNQHSFPHLIQALLGGDKAIISEHKIKSSLYSYNMYVGLMLSF